MAICTLRASSPGDPLGGLTRLGLAPGNRRLFEALIEHAPFGVFVADCQGACLYANARLCELTGLPFEQQLGFGWRRALHPEDVEQVEAAWAEAQTSGSSLAQDQRFVRPDGTVAWIEMTASIVADDEGGAAGWAGVCLDVTERRQSEDRYRQLVEHARDAIYQAGPGGDIRTVNEAAAQLTGYSREELVGMNFFDLVAPEDAEYAQAAFARSLSGVDESRIELRLATRDGRGVYVDVSGRLVEEAGRPVRFEGIARDITEQHRLQEELAHGAFHDPLTALPNRALFFDRLGHALAGVERSGAALAVILLDVDNFKLVNDSLGHDVGDELLVAVAARLLEEMRDGDTVARLGGDEFALVIESLHDELGAVAIAERVVAALQKPILVADGVQRVSASVGIALACPGDEPGTILRKADTAMYAAKASKRGSVRIFDDGMRGRVLRELEVKNALAAAVENGELQVYYQPIVALDGGEVLAVEALVRWLHPEWGWVQPNEFIPIAEADGLIVSLGRFVLVEAIRQAALWCDRRPDGLPQGVFVNVSARELATPEYAAFVREKLREHDVSPARFGLEITERTFVDERDARVAVNLGELAALGVRLILDDFGTGYSALASVKRFPFAALKIDRFFVRSIKTAADSAPVTAAIVGLGISLGVAVIAEGVETRVQADYLRRLGCQAAQGFYYARPQPAEAISTLLDASWARGSLAASSAA